MSVEAVGPVPLDSSSQAFEPSSAASLRKNRARALSVEPDGWARHRLSQERSYASPGLPGTVCGKRGGTAAAPGGGVVLGQSRTIRPPAYRTAGATLKMTEQSPYPHVPSSPRFPEIEERVLKYWDEDGTFVASVENRAAGENGANEFVFYDGPPFANGLPHYGHLLTGYVKDVVPRYQTMRGRRVERRFGWDTHGLPAELEAMSQLGIKTKEEILEVGIETFNAKCRESVLRYTDEWRGLRHAAGSVGRLRPRLQDARPRLHGVGDLGVQAALRQGPGLRGLPGAALLLERPDAAVHARAADGRRRLPEPARPGRHRRPAPGDRRARPGLDHHAVDPPGQPRNHGRPRHRLRRRRVGTSPALPSATSSARRGSAHTPRTSSPTTTTRRSTSSSA